MAGLAAIRRVGAWVAPAITYVITAPVIRYPTDSARYTQDTIAGPEYAGDTHGTPTPVTNMTSSAKPAIAAAVHAIIRRRVRRNRKSPMSSNGIEHKVLSTKSTAVRSPIIMTELGPGGSSTPVTAKVDQKNWYAHVAVASTAQQADHHQSPPRRLAAMSGFYVHNL
jgi:hypothetical protein